MTFTNIAISVTCQYAVGKLPRSMYNPVLFSAWDTCEVFYCASDVRAAVRRLATRWPRLHLQRSRLITLTFISALCLGCKLLGHQRLARCYLQDGGKHDQRQNPRGDQKDFQYQKWFHRGRGSPGKTISPPSRMGLMRSGPCSYFSSIQRPYGFLVLLLIFSHF